MWHDNETSIDLLGFDQLVDTITLLTKNKALLPLTIGAFGDWGSGKSSLMRMVYDRLERDEPYVCAFFSPWQYEGYDDVKAALMAAVLTALRSRRGVFERATEGLEKAEGRLAKLFSRIDWFRTIGFAAKGIGTIALAAHGNPLATVVGVSSVEDLQRLLRPEQLRELGERFSAAGKELLKEPQTTVEIRMAGKGQESIEQSIGAFRKDFAELLNSLPIEAVVVFVDDLDRCLPENIVEVFAVLRLFLSAPKTAFVIGADERIIRNAIGSRYPEMTGQLINIGRTYLEKIVQVPLRIPPLNAAETESYLNLLGCQLLLPNDSWRRLVQVAAENRRRAVLGVVMNYGIARSNLPDVPAELGRYMNLVGRIAAVLSSGYQGNPRYIKRFMNTLLLRQKLAEIRSVNLDQAVLAKLMLLEYFHESQWRQLFGWQADGNGHAPQLATLEPPARGEDSGGGELTRDLQVWLEDPALRSWLCIEPSLIGINLEPYFHFSRDRLFVPSEPSRRLSQPQQELLANLLSDAEAVRTRAVEDARGLSIEELRPVYDELLVRFQRDPRSLDSRLGPELLQIAAQKPELVSALGTTLRGVAPSGIQPALAIVVTTVFGGNPPTELRDVLEGWTRQTESPGLAASARRALTPRPRRQ